MHGGRPDRDEVFGEGCSVLPLREAIPTALHRQEGQERCSWRCPNFTEDAVSEEQDGPAFGREAIERLWADRFQKVHFTNNIIVVDEDSPHIVGTDGKQMWATGRWSAIIQDKDWGPKNIKGYWSVIREGDDWKIRIGPLWSECGYPHSEFDHQFDLGQIRIYRTFKTNA